MTESRESILCLCGCGQETEIPTYYDRSYSPPRAFQGPRLKYVRGHDRHWLEKNKQAPKCKCGCGSDTKWNKYKRVWNEFIRSHNIGVEGHEPNPGGNNRRGKKFTPEQLQKLSSNSWWKNQPEEIVEARRQEIKIRMSGENNKSYIDGRSHRGPRSYPREVIHGRTTRLHRLVMERSLNRPLLKTEVVHHIDNDIHNLNLDNLFLFHCQRCHMHHHRQEKPLQYEYDIDHTKRSRKRKTKSPEVMLESKDD